MRAITAYLANKPVLTVSKDAGPQKSTFRPKVRAQAIHSELRRQGHKSF
jgi:hypothetical protein